MNMVKSKRCGVDISMSDEMCQCKDCGKALFKLEEMWGDNGHILCGDCLHKRQGSRFEDVGVDGSMDDGRHDVSDKMLMNLERVAYAQDDFGMDKYKTPLRSRYNYDWLEMLREELADGLKYLENEVERKQIVIDILENALELENFDLVKSAIHILKISGTGKEKNPS